MFDFAGKEFYISILNKHHMFEAFSFYNYVPIFSYTGVPRTTMKLARAKWQILCMMKENV